MSNHAINTDDPDVRRELDAQDAYRASLEWWRYAPHTPVARTCSRCGNLTTSENFDGRGALCTPCTFEIPARI